MRLEKKNALTLDMYNSLANALQSIEDNPKIKVAIIQGQAGCFTSGNDINDFMQQSVSLDNEHPAAKFLLQLANFKKILIASVDGLAIGIGTTMLLHCDLVIASHNSSFQLPFINLGLCPEAAASYLLPKIVGKSKANEWLLTGKLFEAPEALQAGLINRITEPDKLAIESFKTAEAIATKSLAALQKTKQLLRHDINIICDVIIKELKEFKTLLNSNEAKIAFNNFLSK